MFIIQAHDGIGGFFIVSDDLVFCVLYGAVIALMKELTDFSLHILRHFYTGGHNYNFWTLIVKGHPLPYMVDAKTDFFFFYFSCYGFAAEGSRTMRTMIAFSNSPCTYARTTPRYLGGSLVKIYTLFVCVYCSS